MDRPQPTQVIPYLFYRDVPDAIAFLTRAFGFTEIMRHETEGGMHAEVSCRGRTIMMGQGAADWRMQSPLDAKTATMGVFIYLAGVDAHHAAAKAAGAEIVEPPTDRPYGRTYTVRDLDGHPWFFTEPPP